jgi:gamma-butyrobetaine dioxygenase
VSVAAANGPPLDPLWLRLSDPSQQTHNGQRLFEISDVLRNKSCVEVKSSAASDEGLRVEWGDGAESFYPTAWLESQQQQASDPAPQQHLWGAGFQEFVPRIQHEELSSGAGQLKVASSLERYGIALLQGVPPKEGMVEEVGNSIGFVRVTNYGSRFDVIDLGAAGNSLAQTNVRIRMHTDNPYRDPFPGLQLLHCLVNASDGGATTFSDGFAVAEALRAEDPAAYALLARHRHPFEYRDPVEGVVLQAEVPVLSLHPSTGEVERVSFNNRSAGCLRLPPAELRAYYAAWARFDELANSSRFQLRLPLKPGELAVFSNSRVLHGREEYASGAGRHIQVQSLTRSPFPPHPGAVTRPPRHTLTAPPCARRRPSLIPEQGCYVDHDAPRSVRGWTAFAARFPEAAAAAAAAAGAEAAAADGEAAGRFDCDVHAERADATLAALATQASFSYGEGIDMLQHALQAAQRATEEGEAPAAVLAALMHDVGNSPQARDAWVAAGHAPSELMVSAADSSIGYARHAELGALFLKGQGFDPEVCGAVRLHVTAKRALVAMDPAYFDQLSQASVDTLAQQGGPLCEAGLAEFAATPGSGVALRLRTYDDQGKEPGKEVPQLEAYRGMLVDHLRARSAIGGRN